MNSNTRRAFAVGVMTACLPWAACDDGPKNPAAPTSTLSPVQTPGATLAITGSLSLSHPGETTALRAVLTSADGQRRDVTDETTWSVSDVSSPQTGWSFPRSVNMNAPGTFAALSYGWANVIAKYSGQSASAPLRVVPPGAFLLFGIVEDEGGKPTSADDVEISSTAGTFNAAPDQVGRFCLPATGDAVLRVRRQGSPSFSKPVNVSTDSSIVVHLPPLAAGPLTGTYRLTFSPAPSCQTFQEAASVVDLVEKADGLITVFADGSRFVGYCTPGFTGKRQGDSVTFQLEADIFAQYCFVDGNVGYAGTAQGTVAGETIRATFNGMIGAPARPGAVSCSANDHQMQLVRIRISS
jgi:hypothetical protein